MTSGEGDWGTEGQLREGVLFKENFQQHVSTEKKINQVRVKFYLGQNEDYNL